MFADKIVDQKLLHSLFEYRDDGNLIHKTTIRGGKQKGETAGSLHNAGYIQIQLCGKKYLIHRLIWLFHFGYFPNQIDHVNRIRSDNRIENLRNCTYGQNHGNSGIRRDNTSGVKGVFLDKRDGFWMGNVANRYVGRFKTKEEAAAAYDHHAINHFREFALTNKTLGMR
jgi:hypothetical protein